MNAYREQLIAAHALRPNRTCTDDLPVFVPVTDKPVLRLDDAGRSAAARAVAACGAPCPGLTKRGRN